MGRNSRFVNKGISALESSVIHVIEQIFPPDVYLMISGGRFNILKSPKGNWLEIDLYIPGLPLAIEVQGQQHYTYSRRFFKNKTEWDYYRECDQTKRDVLWRMGIPFLELGVRDKIEVPTVTQKLRELCNKPYHPAITGQIMDYVEAAEAR